MQTQTQTQTVRLTMAQALVRFLDAQYIKIDGAERKFIHGIMGIFGHGNVTGLGEALEHYRGDLQYIQGKNEQGIAHTAIAYAKQHNRLEMMACTSSIGPGALNMITAAGTATVNRIPLLLLPGDIFACRQPDPVLQQLEVASDYTLSVNDAFKPVSRYWDRILRPEQLISAALQAMRVLTDPADTGAVTLCLPQDVQAEAYDYPLEFFNKRVHEIDRLEPSGSALGRAVQLIQRKQRPLMILGGGVHYSLATEEARKFAEAFEIPVVETQAGKSALAWDHRLNMGAIGVTGSLPANQLAAQADLILCVGTRLADFTTASKTVFQGGNVEFLSINVNRYDAAKLQANQLVADAKSALTALLSELHRAGYRSGYDSAQLDRMKEDWDRETARLYAAEHPGALSQTRVLGELNRWMDDNSVIVCAAGSLPGDLHRIWRSKQPKSYHMEYGFSCMGYEIAGALGIKLAEPDKEVYALVGDGSYLMLHSELLTSLQEGQKINVLLFDNSGFQCIHGLQTSHGSEGFGNEFRSRSQESGRLTGEVMPVDYAAHAASMGVKSYFASTVDELRQALQDAMKQQRSTLIHMRVAPGTGTNGYASWWRVDVAEVSESKKVQAARKEMAENLQQARSHL